MLYEYKQFLNKYAVQAVQKNFNIFLISSEKFTRMCWNII